MANLTVSIEDNLLQQAREAALRDRTSVNALVRDFLAHCVDAKRRRFDALDALDAVAARCESSSTGTWARESLY